MKHHIVSMMLFLAPLSVHAGDPAPILKGFSLDYANGRGSAQAAHAEFTLEGVPYVFDNARFDARQEAGNLVVESPLNNFSYTLEAPFLKDVEKARARDVNFEAIPGKVDANFSNIRLEQKKDTTNVGRTSLKCAAAASVSDPVDACIVSGRFTLASLVSAPNRGDTNLEDASVSINRGKVDFAVKIAGIGKINGEGTATHDPEKDEIRVRVQKVKYGILDITGQFFSLLEDNQGDGESFKVQRPYLIFRYGDASR